MLNLFNFLSRRFIPLLLLTGLLVSSTGSSDSASARPLQLLPDDSALVAQSSSQTVATGQSFSIFITMENTGSNTWEPGTYWLENVQAPMGAGTQQALSFSVTPGGSSSWTINMVAPAITGIFHSQWRVSNSGVTFGQTADITITVRPPNVAIAVAGVNQGKYLVPRNKVKRPSFVGVNNGVVKVLGLNSTPILVSQRAIFMDGLVRESFVQIQGLPSAQLSTRYYFPIYNNVSVQAKLVLANTGTLSTNVTVTIAGVVKGTYPLAPSQMTTVSYAGLNAGPVVVQSSGGVKIIAALSELLVEGGVGTSWSQMIGLPAGQLAGRYLFPVYNNLGVKEQFIFANVGKVDTRVRIRIGGITKGSYLLHPNQVKSISYAGLSGGPVEVRSMDGAPIVVVERDLLMDGTARTSWSQWMGLSASQLKTQYYFPLYDNVSSGEQLIIANVGAADTTVTVKIAGVLRGTYLLHPNKIKRVSFVGVNAGPVVVQSSGGVNIIASERDLLLDGTTQTSWSQVMGLPVDVLPYRYFFPLYDSINLRESFIISRP